MPIRCDTCGTTQAPEHPVHALDELGFGQGHEDQQIHLCGHCMDLREARRWDREHPDALRLLDALAERSEPPEGRYSYLTEPGGPIHLMRLHPDWVDQHARGQAPART